MESHKSFTNGLPDPAPTATDGDADGAHLAGEIDSLPPTWCRKCEADVTPIGKGQCPRCGRVLRNSFLARRHPVNKLRRQQLLDQFVNDYKPDTQRLRSMCEQYAGVVEQLEVLKPGSAEHQRLVQLSQLLGSALEESRAPKAASSNVTTEQVEATLMRCAQMLGRLDDFEKHRADAAGLGHPARTDPPSVESGLAGPARMAPQPRTDDTVTIGPSPEDPAHPATGDPHTGPDPKPTYSLRELYLSGDGLITDVFRPSNSSRADSEPTAEMIESLCRQREG